MVFSSNVFIFYFLPTVLVLYYIALKINKTLSHIVLVLASLFFYGYWEIKNLWIIIATIIFNYFWAVLLSKENQKKIFLYLGIIVNLTPLFIYKYFDFFAKSLHRISGLPAPLLNLILPIGISFFTFQQIAYLVDSFEEKKCEKSLINYALFVSFFPQLIAGPIVHHKEILPQFNEKQKFNSTEFLHGLYFFILGMTKKLLIADYLSAHLKTIHLNNTLDYWIVSLSFTFQIYFDFSGYSDMAIGLGKLFGIKLPQNFNSPYKACSISDFWRRWHITLGRFLFTYIYKPLGGSKVNQNVTLRNLFITFLISGLWHGAGLAFIVWGVFHGIAIVVQRLYKAYLKKYYALSKHISWALTFLFINTTWVFFRYGLEKHSTKSALKFIKKMYDPLLDPLRDIRDLIVYGNPSFKHFGNYILIFLIFIVFLANNLNQNEKANKIRTWKFFLLGIALALCILALNSHKIQEFIYFNF